MNRCTTRLVALLSLMTLGTSGVLHAAPRPKSLLSRVTKAYGALDYEQCVSLLEKAPASRRSLGDEARLQMYWGLCAYNLGDRDNAVQHFQAALSLDPKLTLPALTSPRIAQLFESLRPQPPHEEPAPVVAAPAAPAPDVPPAEPPSPSPNLTPQTPQVEESSALVQTPDRRFPVVPVALAGAGAVAAGIGTYLAIQAKSAESRFNNPATTAAEADRLGPRAVSQAQAANILFGVGLTLAVSAVVTYVLLD